MTSPPGPPSYPPYAPPPPYGGPPRGSSAATVVTSVLAVVFVLACVIAAVAVNAHEAPSRATAQGAPPPCGSSTATVVTSMLAVVFVLACVIAAVAVNAHEAPSTATAQGAPQSPGLSAGVPSGSYSATTSGYPTPTYATPTLPTTSYAVPTPTPTRVPLDGQLVNRTFQVYMNALLSRSLSTLRSATCPRLRKSETGTALDGKYISRWRSSSYRIYDSLDYVIIPTRVRYIDPRTGGNGGSKVYNWYVERYPDGRYWVCGIQ